MDLTNQFIGGSNSEMTGGIMTGEYVMATMADYEYLRALAAKLQTHMCGHRFSVAKTAHVTPTKYSFFVDSELKCFGDYGHVEDFMLNTIETFRLRG